MKRREVRLELLVGKQVFGLNGHAVGRLEDVRAELNNRGDCFVSEYLIGTYGMLQRLSVWRIGRTILRTFHLRKHGYRIHWEQLDLSDPRRPQLRCAVEELVPLT